MPCFTQRCQGGKGQSRYLCRNRPDSDPFDPCVLIFAPLRETLPRMRKSYICHCYNPSHRSFLIEGEESPDSAEQPTGEEPASSHSNVGRTRKCHRK